MITKFLLNATDTGLELGLAASTGGYCFRFKFKDLGRAQDFRRHAGFYQQKDMQDLTKNAAAYYYAKYVEFNEMFPEWRPV